MEENNKKFSMPFAELALFASKTVANMIRDAVEFAIRGVDAAAITAFEALGNSFEVFPPDEVYVGEIKDLTTEKNTLRDTITDEIQLISGFFEQKWGADSGKYTSLRIGGLQKMTEANYLLTCRNVVEMATNYLADLTLIGLTQAMIDSLETNAQSFEDKLIEINNKKELRDEKASERVDLANELYDYVALYCKIGKLIWENVSEAKYNDYIIYPTEHHGLSKPQNVAANYDPLNPPNITLTWDLVAEATSYDVFFDIAETGAPSGDFEFLNNFPAPPAMIPAIFEKRNYFKLKAKNDENTSPYSDEAWVDVPAGPVV